MWTAARASGRAVAPLVGASIGIAIAIALCWGLSRRALRLNIGVFFSRTAIALIVIAAGVLAYGLGDLQEAGLLPGHAWVAFDLSGHIDTGSWWVSIISGLTNLTPTIDRLAGRRVGHLPRRDLVELPQQARPGTSRGRCDARRREARTVQATVRAGPGHWERLAGQRTWVVAGVLVAVPALAAGTTIAALPTASSASSTVTVTNAACGQDFTSAHAGTQTFTVQNSSAASAEVQAAERERRDRRGDRDARPGDQRPAVAHAERRHLHARMLHVREGRDVLGPGDGQRGDHRDRPGGAQARYMAALTPPNNEYQAYAMRRSWCGWPPTSASSRAT